MSALSLLERVRLDKAATDAGFDVKQQAIGNWLAYSSTSCPLRICITVPDTVPVAALSMENVIAELGLTKSAIAAPAGFAGTVAMDSFDELQSELARAYALANALPHELLHIWEAKVASLLATEREATVRQRVGHDLFRGGLIALWNGQCALSGLAVPELLRASHAKPWAVASDAERLDVYNGLLLAAHLDAAFDQGLITFSPKGELSVSAHLGTEARQLLGLDRAWPLLRLKPQHEVYLAYHRAKVFKP